MQNIKKSQLLEIIRAVVRETIKERKDKWIQKAVDPKHKGYCTPMTKDTCTPRRKALAQRFKRGDLSEAGLTSEDGEQSTPLSNIRTMLKNIQANLYSEEAVKKFTHEQAIYVLLKIKKIIDVLADESMKESAHKVVSPNQTDTAKEDKARTIQTDPTVNEASYKVVAPHAYEVQMDNKALTIQTEPEINEASYKVVAARQARVQKDDHARKVQSDPKVTENHKVQARSAKTVQDLDNDPKNVRDPEVPQA